MIDSERERGLLDHIPLSILSRIKAMELQTTKVCQEAIEFVRNDDEKYFEQMRYVIERPWMVFKKEKKINGKLRWDSKHYKRTSGSKYSISPLLLILECPENALFETLQWQVLKILVRHHSKNLLAVRSLRSLPQYSHSVKRSN